MLANDEAVEGVVLGDAGVIAGLPAGAIHVSSSTISVALAERLAAAHGKAGQRYVAAPVFGRPDVAAAGQLFVIAAGEPAAVDTAAPLFDAIGQKTLSLRQQEAELGGAGTDQPKARLAATFVAILTVISSVATPITHGQRRISMARSSDSPTEMKKNSRKSPRKGLISA
jgi:6-phosphogluconate dehydrogenase-like protein